MVSVAIVDDQPLFRQALADVVFTRGNARVSAEFGSAVEAIAAMPAVDPDVCIVDLSPAGGDSIVVLKGICESNPRTRVLMLTDDNEGSRVWTMLEEGASGVVLKTAEADEIADAVVSVAHGETFLPERLHRGLAEQIRSRRSESRSQLTAREVQILCSVAEGNSAAEIATHLSLAESTVKTHLTRIYDKLGVSERAAAVAEAMRRGLID